MMPLSIIPERTQWQHCIQFILAILLAAFTLSSTAQTPVKGIPDPFKPSVIGQLPILIPPVQSGFQPVTIRNNLPGLTFRLTGQQNLAQKNPSSLAVNNAYDVLQKADIEGDLMQTELYCKHIEWLENSNYYRAAFSQLTSLNLDSFSLTKAVYLVENAYMDNKHPYAEFKGAIQQRVPHAKQIIKREGLNTKSNTDLNYGIQKLYAQQNPFKALLKLL